MDSGLKTSKDGMNLGLKVLSDDKVLFDSVVYTKKSTDLHSLMYYEESRKGGKIDFDFLDNIRNKRLNKEGLLFLQSESESGKYLENILKTETFHKRLMIVKGAIADERLPSVLVRRWVEESEEYDDGNAYIYPMEEHFGRDWILKVVKKYNFTPALPEVRKVILDGLCPYLKTVAIDTISSLGGKYAADTLALKLEDKKDLVIVRDTAATGLINFSYPSSVPALIRTFEETVYISPYDLYEKEKEMLGGGDRHDIFGGFGYEVNKKIINNDWLPMICLEALSNIPTEESIQTLEKATNISLENTSNYARNCIGKWIDKNEELLKKEYEASGRVSDFGARRLSKLKRLVYDYDLRSKSKRIYDANLGMMTLKDDSYSRIVF